TVVTDSMGNTSEKTFEIRFYQPLKNNSTISGTKVVAGSSVTVNGKVYGGTGEYEYKFYYKNSSQSEWTEFGSGTSAEFTPAADGTFDIKVIVTDTMNISAEKLFTVTAVKPLTNNSTVSSEKINVGDTVMLNGAASGGYGEYTYKFYYKRSTASSWTEFGSGTSAAFKPSSAGAFVIRIFAYDGMGNKAYKEFNVTAVAPLVNNTTVSKTSIKLGETVDILGSASGGAGDYTYEFYYRRTTSNTWISFGSDNTAALKPSSAGVFDVLVYVKDSMGGVSLKTFRITAEKEYPALENKTTVSAENFKVGQTVTITGAASGGSGDYTYEFFYKRTTAKSWTQFGNETTAKLKPSSAGVFDVIVYVKDSAGNAEVSSFTLTASK
ncbi:MAG: hypothetical protein IIT42_04005, partial [Clostridia bacterium]|nr:hypothetical protein [Clostridia bacterium]